MKEKMERRTYRLELRDAGADGSGQLIAGHAAVFNSLSEDLGGFKEKIAPGAFTAAVSEDDVRALWNHNADYVLGRTKSGTLRLKEDTVGLAIEIDPPDTSYARDLIVSMDRGDVDQMSFGFWVVRDLWEQVEPDVWVRTLLEVRLFDVSPVTYPAYTDTSVAVRSMTQAGLCYDPSSKVIKQPEEKRGTLDLLRMELDILEHAV